MLEKMSAYARQNRPFIFILDFDLQAPIVLPFEEAAEQAIFFDFNGYSNRKIPTTSLGPYFLESFPKSFTEYKEAFEFVQAQLRLGNSFLTNLTFPTKILTNLTFPQIFAHSQAKYKLLFKDQFVCFSPEPFVKIQDGQIYSFPMKGTIDATLPNAAKKLLGDFKERAEHHTIVDLIRNDLGRIATKVRVERFQYLERIQSANGALLQASSKIVGQLPKNYDQHLGELFEKLLPAGSITGAPKRKTVEIIKTAEGYQRGYYTGVCGYYQNGYLESGVMIRFIERVGQELFYKSGGGITVFSDVEKEYRELIQKIYVPIDRNNQDSQWHSTQHWATSSETQ